jgi:hypothetical protein
LQFFKRDLKIKYAENVLIIKKKKKFFLGGKFSVIPEEKVVEV